MKFLLSEKNRKEIIKDRKEIEKILAGKDRRMILIAGPCSAWPSSAVIEYAERLKKVSDEVEPFLKIILRVYTQKPRTIAGWNGPLIEPDPFKSPNLEKGMQYVSNLMNKILEIGLPIADEALFLEPSMKLSKYLSWAAIGARSSEDQEHRGFASGLNLPVGIKNPTSGSIRSGVESVLAVQFSQISLLYSAKKRTVGNPLAHLVLRGGKDENNSGKSDLETAVRLLKENKIKNPSIIIDASHGNCVRKKMKNHNLQIENIRKVLKLIKNNPDLQKYIKGFMVESFLKDGSQDLRKKNIDKDGLSITDPCLSWDKTKDLIFEIAQDIKKQIKKYDK